MLQRFIYFLFKPPWTIIGKIFGKGKKVGEEEGEEQKQYTTIVPIEIETWEINFFKKVIVAYSDVMTSYIIKK